jgi:hypothetical protein
VSPRAGEADAAAGTAPTPPPAEPPGVSEAEWTRVGAWAKQQHGRFRDHWMILTGKATSLDRSQSDWVLALGLSQVRFQPELIQRALLNMPGSKARALWFREGTERAHAYTRHTIASAWQVKHAADPYQRGPAEA